MMGTFIKSVGTFGKSVGTLKDSLLPGCVVVSEAGRDKGQAFVIVAIEGGYVYLTDGRTRGVAKPKKKKIKHVSPAGYKSERLAELIGAKGAAAPNDEFVAMTLREWLNLQKERDNL